MTENKSLFLIDGSSYIYRAFFGIPNLSNSKGFPTNAVWGFLKMLKSLVKYHNPQYLIIALDAKGSTFRKDIYPEYKANRSETPNELIVQLPYIDKIINAIGIYSEKIQGVEADDIIASYTKQAEENGFKVTIISGDKDLLQLINEKTCMIDTMLNKKYEIKNVIEKYGVSPALLTDFFAITGDASDNIPGVRGIGPKGASKLLSEYGTLENIYSNVDTIKNLKHKEALIKNADNAKLSKELVKLKSDLSLDFNSNKFIIKNHHNDDLRELFLELEFISEIKEWNIDLKTSSTQDTSATTNQKCNVINVINNTTIECNGELIGYDLLHNINFTTLLKYKKIFDLKIAAHLLSPTKKEYDLNDTSILYSGSNFDIKNIVDLRNKINQQLINNKLDKAFQEVELPCITVLSQIQETGCLVDVKHLEELSKEFTESINIYTDKIYQSAGMDFNINSPKQLSFVLFEKLNLPIAKKTSSGYSTTSQDVLEELAQLHELPKLIIEYRELVKLRSTYIEPLLDEAKSGDQRIRTLYHLDVTSTGRLSSTNPNLQNIPIRTSTGSKIREVFIAPQGKVLISADYSQIELRIFAHLSNDKIMMESFKNNEDIHTRTASEIFDVQIELVTPDQRRQAKAINFGILYGKTPFGLAKELGITQSIASKIIKRYFERYSGIAQTRQELIEKAKKYGYTETMYGRKRELPEITSKNHIKRSFAERNAINSPIQGTASDIMKIAMVKLWKRLFNEFPNDAKIILHVHDELVIEASQINAQKIISITKQEMENAVNLLPRLVVDIGSGKNWLEAH